MKKIFKKLAALALTALLLFTVMPVFAEAPEINIVGLTNNNVISDFELYPVVSGDNVVWSVQNDSSSGGEDELYFGNLSDLSTFENPTNITTVDGVYARHPRIDGVYVVWSGFDGAQSDLYLTIINDADTFAEPINLTPNTPDQEPSYYDVSGNNVVFSDFEFGSDIFVIDITNPSSPSVAVNLTPDTPESTQTNPKISGDYVIWEDTESGNNDIYLYDLSGGVPAYQINDAGTDAYMPEIDGDKIVWLDDSYWNCDIWVYDIIQGGEPSKITDTYTYREEITIYGDMIVWGDGRNDPGDWMSNDIYVMKLDDMIETRIAHIDDNWLSYPSISDNNIVYSANDGNTGDIYLAALTYPSEADTTPPTYETLPGDTKVVNLTEGELITTNPYIIKVNPTDDTAVEKVEFYVDGFLICTDTTPDAEGVYSCAWDTSKYHSDIRILTYDTSGNTTELLRTVTVDPSLYLTTLPRTGREVRSKK